MLSKIIDNALQTSTTKNKSNKKFQGEIQQIMKLGGNFNHRIHKTLITFTIET